jgi:Lon protease-like protein
MSKNPFITPFESLPNTLPIFPLPGAMLMPGAELPLNIFEPRYLNMVNDAVASHRMIGMIQPDPNGESDNAIYGTGCSGRITQFRETSDCRIEMVLTGVCRFDVGEELPTTRGYRLVVPEWSRFADDYLDNTELLQDEHARLLKTLERFFDVKGYEADLTMLKQLPTVRLVDSLTMALPFDIGEKQMLLETVDAEGRLANLIALLEGDYEVPDSATRH